MESKLNTLTQSFPGRGTQIDQLFRFFAAPPFPPCLYISGSSSTGKSNILRAVFDALHIKHATINLIECYTPKILFESIINKLTRHKIDPKSGTPFAKCDNFMEFVDVVDQAGLDRAVVVIHKAEELRTMDFNLLPVLLDLGQYIRARISVVLVSEVAFEKFYYKLNIVEPFKLHFPQYSKDELLQILAMDFEYVQTLIDNTFGSDSVHFDKDFYHNYLNMFLSVFYRTCRDLSELRYMSRKNFVVYCDPIHKKELTVKDSMALWKRVSPAFTTSAETLYLRVSQTATGKLSENLDLPYYAKYLLIAAYLASYNSIKDDKRLFMKYHGKKRKTRKETQQKSKVDERLNTQLGPKAFTLDRLLAIFYSILDDKVGFNNHLLVQVSSLVELQLLSLVSDESNLNSRKYKCTVDFDTIQNVARNVSFNIRKYLSDFSHI